MNYTFKYSIFIFPFILSACSSPPEPQAVNWSAKAELLNNTLPEWNKSGSVNTSANVDGKWIKTIKGFDINKPFGIGVYYAVAHSTRIIVKTNSSQRWFDTKTWLRSHGANGVIDFEYAKGCMTCNTVDVSLSRGIPVVLAQTKPYKHKQVVPTKGVLSKNNKFNGSTDSPLLSAQRSKLVTPAVDKNSFGKKSSPAPLVIPLMTTAKVPPKALDQVVANKAVKVTVPMSKDPPQQHWSIERGENLKDGIMRWAAKEKCSTGSESWVVIWSTEINYRIDAQLAFTGTFKEALNELFLLYKKADKPLYPYTNTPQCLIKVNDKPE